MADRIICNILRKKLGVKIVIVVVTDLDYDSRNLAEEQFHGVGFLIGGNQSA